MNTCKPFRMCPWLWALLSASLSGCLLFVSTQDKEGGIHSDWATLVYHVQREPVANWGSWRSIAFWDLLIPVVLGWILQFLFLIACYISRDKERLPDDLCA